MNEILANLVVVLHFSFVLFVGLGGLLVIRWRRWAWIHVPAFLWGVLISFQGWVCPLTPLENWFRMRGGESGYATSFIEHTIIPVLYPAQLTRELQGSIGFFVLGINLFIYGFIWVRRKIRLRGECEISSI